jgi:hypothetical protein
VSKLKTRWNVVFAFMRVGFNWSSGFSRYSSVGVKTGPSGLQYPYVRYESGDFVEETIETNKTIPPPISRPNQQTWYDLGKRIGEIAT